MNICLSVYYISIYIAISISMCIFRHQYPVHFICVVALLLNVSTKSKSSCIWNLLCETTREKNSNTAKHLILFFFVLMWYIEMWILNKSTNFKISLYKYKWIIIQRSQIFHHHWIISLPPKVFSLSFSPVKIHWHKWSRKKWLNNDNKLERILNRLCLPVAFLRSSN